MKIHIDTTFEISQAAWQRYHNRRADYMPDGRTQQSALMDIKVDAAAAAMQEIAFQVGECSVYIPKLRGS